MVHRAYRISHLAWSQDCSSACRAQLHRSIVRSHADMLLDTSLAKHKRCRQKQQGVPLSAVPFIEPQELSAKKDEQHAFG